MTVAKLMPLVSTAPQFFSPGTYAAAGNRFHVTADGFSVTALQWYRGSTSDTAPTKFRLWRVSDGALLADPVGADDGAVGWQYIPISPVPLTANVDYMVSLHGNTFRYADNSVAGEAPLVWVSQAYTADGGGANPMPAVNGNIQEYGASVEVSDAGAPPPPEDPATPTDLQNALASWFSPSDATHPAGDAGMYPNSIMGLWGKMDHDGITLDAKMGPMLAYGGIGPQGLSGGMEVVRTRVNDVATAVAALPAGATPAAVAAVQAAVDALSEALVGNFGRLFASPAFPSAPWTLADEIDFDQSLAWAVAADLYVVTVTSIPPQVGIVDVAGVAWRPRLFWWCSLNGDFAGERHFADFANSHVALPPGRMPGLLIGSSPGTGGHVQAWTLGG